MGLTEPQNNTHLYQNMLICVGYQKP